MHVGNQDHRVEERPIIHQEEDDSNRRQGERRHQKSEGYAYISMVGWMDRRSKKRREDDDYDFW